MAKAKKAKTDAEGGVSREAAEEAVRVLLRWAGDDPEREGLLETPKRVVNAYRDWFSGYAIDPAEYLAVDDGRVVVIGRYRGPARDGRSTVDAAFAHVITARDDRIAALHQITDTARWNIPRP